MRRFRVKWSKYLEDDKVIAEGVMFTEGLVVIFDLDDAAITIYKNIEDFPDTINDMYVVIEWIDQIEDAIE